MKHHDVAKIANGLSRPGIDPRKFVEIGVVTAVDVTDKGVHVDFISSEGVPETAAVSPPYGGPGYGLHLPIDLDRIAVLAIPDGKFNAGARVVGTVWDEGDTPPQEAIDNRDDVVLVVKPGQSLRIIVTGGGDAIIEARDGGTVQLGHPGGIAGRSPALSTDDGAAFMTALQAAITAQSGNPPGAAALSALQAALQNIRWPSGAAGVLIK